MNRLRYTGIAQFFHWLVAAFIFVLFPLGWTMDDFSGLQRFQAYNFHKSLGITVFALVILRIMWRISHPAPELPKTIAAFERYSAHAAHYALYTLLLLMPLSGWALISVSDKPSVLFNYTAFPLMPYLSTIPVDQKKELSGYFDAAHVFISYALLALIVLHIVAALRHAIILRDGVFSRMWPSLASKRAITAFFFASTCGIIGAPDHAKAETKWTIDQAKSTIGFEASGSGYLTKGQFKSYKADVAFDPQNIESTNINVVIDIKSIATSTPDVDATLKSSDFFNIAKFPDATFETQKAKKIDDTHYVLNGQLKMKGITKPVDVPFTLKVQDKDASLKVDTTIDRMAFGIGPETVSGLPIDKNVKLTFDIKATKQN